MRELKFRVWSNQLNKMVYQGEDGWFDKCFIEKKQHVHSCQLGVAIERNGKELSVMQYTGSKDKNDTEIYEGDVLTIWIGGVKQERPEVVESLEELYLNFNRDDSYYRFSSCEVIGNVYETPELLEVTQ
jgi:hypothetical protein